MENTLRINDRVLVSKVPYYLHDPQRGDIIVFSDPDPSKQPQRSLIGGAAHWLFQGIGFQKPDDEDFIKRVIGVPGDTVVGQERQGLRERRRDRRAVREGHDGGLRRR